MPIPRLSPRARLSALLGPDPADARQSFVALSIGLLAAMAAGLVLGAITDTLEALPGLLVLAPAANSLRGNVFGALGARLSTAIHTGTFSSARRPDSVAGQNVLASLALSFTGAVVLAAMAKAVSVGFGIADSISLAEFVTISVLAALMASAVVVVITVSLAAASVRYGWDSDNVMAPLVTGAGDLLSLPTLFLATYVVDREMATDLIAVASVLAAAAAVAVILRSSFVVLRRILLESSPVLVVAGLLSLIAGVTLQGALDSLAEFPALLVLVPPFLSSTGAVGGILASRLTSKLHLGLLEPSAFPARAARADIGLVYLVALLVFAAGSLVADLAAVTASLGSPGPVDMLLVSVIGGLLATTFAVSIGYYTAVLTFRVGLDPDNYAIPMVSSSLDLLGSVSFILAVAVFVAVPS